jgi:hypothetical protein
MLSRSGLSSTSRSSSDGMPGTKNGAWISKGNIAAFIEAMKARIPERGRIRRA